MLVVCWGGLIWILGGDSFSLAHTKETLLPWLDWLDWLTGGLDDRSRYWIFHGLRKVAHVSEYGILALLAFRARLMATEGFQPTAAGCRTALFIVVALASADEARQVLSPVRTGSPYDVLLDLAGGVVAVIGGLLFTQRRRHEQDPNDF
jgi:VanZ family protein